MIKRVFNHWLEETVKEITKRNLTEITFSTGKTPSGSKSGSRLRPFVQRLDKKWLVERLSQLL